jgi:hypothetical protein
MPFGVSQIGDLRRRVYPWLGSRALVIEWLFSGSDCDGRIVAMWRPAVAGEEGGHADEVGEEP